MILNSVLNGPLIWSTIIEENGLPPDVYAIVNHHKVSKEIWDIVKLRMQGTKLSLQEKECELYDEFDKFSFVKGLIVPVVSPRDDTTTYLNKAMAFLTAVAASRFPSTNNQLRTSSNPGNRPLSKTAGLLCNKFKGGKDKVMPVLAIRVMLLVSRETIPEGRQGLLNAIIFKVNDICLGNALSLRGQRTLHGLRKRKCWLKHKNPCRSLI
ncbi:hypothetical protein Tco_1555502 [Tanacetum coccineum]